MSEEEIRKMIREEIAKHEIRFTIFGLIVVGLGFTIWQLL